MKYALRSLTALTLIFCLSCSQKSAIQGGEGLTGSTSCGNMSDVECQMMTAINGQRAAQGLSPLKPVSNCVQMAQDHAKDMNARGYFGHDSPTETFTQRVARYQLNGSYVGENIAGGSLTTAVNNWMASTGHRNNILNSNFRSTGVGRDGNLWVQCFSSRAPDDE